MIENTKNVKLDPTKIDYEKRSRMKKKSERPTEKNVYET